MNKLVRDRALSSRNILSMAVVAALGFSAQAATVNTPDNLGATVITTPQANGIVLKLGHSDSALSDMLASEFSTKAVSQALPESQKAIAAKVAAAKMLYINLHDFYGTETRLNAYLAEALKQNKLMVFENAGAFSEVHLDALPMMAAGEVVLFKAKPGEDQLYVYGDGYSIIEKDRDFDVGGEDAAKQPIKAPLVEDINSKPIRVDAIKMADLQGEKLQMALATVNRKINELLLDDAIVTKGTGGGIGYQCPLPAEQEKLCYASAVINAPYYHSDGNAEINIINHYSYVMYRTSTNTAVAVSPHGSANPTMHVDTNSHRAFYLKSFSVDITPTQTDMGLWDRYPKNRNNEGSINATSGMSFTAGVDASQDPSMGASITYSETNSESMGISDWESVTTTGGYNAKWDFKLSLNKTISDWVTHPVFSNARLDEVPNISKYGLQYTSEGVWTSGSKNTTGWYDFNLKTITKSEQIYFTTNNWFQWAAETTGWTYTLYPGGRSLNRSWLKDL